MILFARFQRFSFIFRIYSPPPPPKKKQTKKKQKQKKPPKNIISPRISFRIFFFETGHLPDSKTVDNISQAISCGLRVFFRNVLAYIVLTGGLMVARDSMLAGLFGINPM